MSCPKIQIKFPSVSEFKMEYYLNDKTVPSDAMKFPPHIHDGLEIYALIEGDVSFLVEDSTYKLSPGDVIIAKPNEIHNCILNTKSVHKHICFNFDCPSDPIFSEFTKHEFGKDNRISPSKADKERLFVLYPEITKAGMEQNERRVFYLTLEMLDILSKNISANAPHKLMPPLMLDIISDINENFTEISNLSYFTNKYYVSQSTLNRMFRVYLHTSPKLYLDTKRLAYSRVLLKEGKSVLDACTQAGFSDCSNYIRLFKKYFSVTPGKYRKG